MPTVVVSPPGRFARVASGPGPHQAFQRDAGTLEIGIVNNMPDAALRRTERQFIGLLRAAAGDRPVRVRLYALPGVPRAEPYLSYTRAAYHDLAALTGSRLDGLIVTGTEPRAASLADEPYWPAFTELTEWAASGALSTFWSCLAAHAAVQHLDGVHRRRFHTKLSGVYRCERTCDHPLLAGLPRAFPVPHSRYNGLEAHEIESAGYHVLSRSDEVPVDIFVRDGASLQVFAQGHPEYDANSLLKEYRRDLRRYLTGERDDIPAPPHGYLSLEAAAAFAAFEEKCRRQRGEALIPHIPYALAERTLDAVWRPAAVMLFRNWLALVADRKLRQEGKAARAAAAPRRHGLGLP